MLVVVGAVAMTACGDDSNSSSPAKEQREGDDDVVGPRQGVRLRRPHQERGDREGDEPGATLAYHREDGESFPGTADYNPERVQFEIDNGKVTKATFG